MSSDSTLWYRVGYALEKARTRTTAAADEEAAARPSRRRAEERGPFPSADDLVATGVAALAGKLLSAWAPARRVTMGAVIRAGVSGAGAALIVELARPLLRGEGAEAPTLDGDTGARLLSGASRGLLYGAVVEPRLPGPPLLKGAVFALAEYLAHPAGGLPKLLASQIPGGRLPVVGDLITDVDVAEQAYAEHLAFGVSLAVLSGSSVLADVLPDEDD